MQLIDQMDSNSSRERPPPPSSPSNRACNDRDASATKAAVDDKLATILNNIRKNKDRAIFDTMRCERRETSKRKSKTDAVVKQPARTPQIDAHIGDDDRDKKDDISALLNFSSDSDIDHSETNRRNEQNRRKTVPAAAAAAKKRKNEKKSTPRNNKKSRKMYVAKRAESESESEPSHLTAASRIDPVKELTDERDTFFKPTCHDKFIRSDCVGEQDACGKGVPATTINHRKLIRRAIGDGVTQRSEPDDDETSRYSVNTSTNDFVRESYKMFDKPSHSCEIDEMQLRDDLDNVPLFADFAKSKSKRATRNDPNSPASSRSSTATVARNKTDAIRRKLQTFAHSSTRAQQDDDTSSAPSKVDVLDECSQAIFPSSPVVEANGNEYGKTSSTSGANHHGNADDTSEHRYGSSSTNTNQNDTRFTQRSMKSTFLSSLDSDPGDWNVLNDL